MDGSDGRWTEERHSHFLNLMEANFVRREFGVTGGVGDLPYRNVRLDRNIPDSATESTVDSLRCSPAEPVIRSESRCSSNTRKRFVELRDVCWDQVVPEFENKEITSGSVKRKPGRGGLK